MNEKTQTREEWANADISSITMLIERARDGSDDARAKVLRKLQPFVISMAAQHNQRWLNNKHGVSDIVQQSFLKVIENFESFRGSSSAEFRSWLKQLVINEIRQIHRNLNRQRRDIKRERSLDNGTSQVAGEVSANDPTPASNAILAEQLTRLKSVINDLDESQRHVIELRAFENLSFREIAKRLNRSQDAVTKVWYRALIQLQKRLSNESLAE